jgi:hypothetical protein
MPWAMIAKGGMKALQTPGGRKAIAGVVVVAVAATVILVGSFAQAVAMVASSISGGATGTIQAHCLSTPTGTGGGGGVTTLDATQTANAAVIMGVAKSIVIPGTTELTVDAARQRAAVIAIATAMQESTLTNLPGGDRDSLGLFQQRPQMSWGTVEQISDPVYATTAFYYGAGTNPGLVDVNSWQTMALTVAAQAVQHSGHPGAYAQWEATAQAAVTATWATAPAIPVAAVLDRPSLTGDIVTVGTSLVPGGDATCGSYTTPTGVDTTGTYAAPQPWGGPPVYGNGRIPPSAMCLIPWDGTEQLRCDAVAALVKLDAAYQADHGGAHLGVSDSYRSFASQVAAKNDWCAKNSCGNAAKPGTSNHGLGMAVDLGGFGGVEQYDAPGYLWMKAHGPAFGWVHPPFMEAGGSGPYEPWHWEFMAAAAPVAGGAA